MISQRDIVLVSFPFSDLQATKVRPALVLSKDSYIRSSEDFVAVPLTSNLKIRDYALLITNNDLESGELIVKSKAKVDRIFSVSQRLVRMKVGRLKSEVYKRVVDSLIGLVSLE